MRPTRFSALLVSAALLLSVACGANAAGDVTDIVLSDAGITVNGKAVSNDPAAAVYTGGEIIYYHDGTDETYGEGTESEKHSAEEAAAHTVVTVTQPGTYRLSGKLSQGQIFVDLGKGAKDDPQAVVTLILDNVDVTCTVAPALFFYRVYECDREFVRYDDDENPDYEATPYVDTTAAGANVVIAAGSVNTFTGSHVARIYKEGTTKKLHKYDGAFYSKMSMNIYGDNGDDSGVLNITADNEGLDSELHLTLNGGSVSIRAQDDGINTNEDFVSVTTVNGGKLTVNAGLGEEGDGIDSNGYLVINGGTVWTMSNERSPDGGVDADSPILINGGTLYAFGTRNDAADSENSKQPYMELAFASTLPAGSLVELKDPEGNTLWSAVTEKSCQSVTLTLPALKLDTAYTLYVDGVLQCWNGSGFGMGRPGGMGGFGGQRPEGMEPPDGMEPPEGAQIEPPQHPDGPVPFDGAGETDPGGFGPGRGEHPEGVEMPEGFDPGGRPEGFHGHGGFPGFGGGSADGGGSTEFTLTAQTRSFSGVRAFDETGGGALPFTDVKEDDPDYAAVKALCEAGAMTGTGAHTFSPDMTVTRAQAVTVLGRLAGARTGGNGGFSDVPWDAWYAGYMDWAVEKGIVEGDGQGHFFPDRTVTAEELALMLKRYDKNYVNMTNYTGELNRSQLAEMLMDIM